MEHTQDSSENHEAKNKLRRLAVIGVAVALLVAGVVYVQHNKHISPKAVLSETTTSQSATALPTEVSVPIGEQTKTEGCVARGALPDNACTPGAIFANVTNDQICKPGYSKLVRNVPTSEKDQVYAEYSITAHKAGQYEVDHFISLELGGSNDIANLWPEPAEPVPGFHEKDKVENHLHAMVCAGQISLSEAQHQIATNWLMVYNTLPN